MKTTKESKPSGLPEIPQFFYRHWYNEKVKPSLTKKQKKALLMKISDYTLQNPIVETGIKIPHKAFPELAKFSSTSEFSGIQLFVVMEELFKELYKKDS